MRVLPQLDVGGAPAEEYEAFAGVVQLELRGQAFLTTEAGNVKVAVGRLVTLDPATTYARAWFPQVRRHRHCVPRLRLEFLSMRYF